MRTQRRRKRNEKQQYWVYFYCCVLDVDWQRSRFDLFEENARSNGDEDEDKINGKKLNDWGEAIKIGALFYVIVVVDCDVLAFFLLFKIIIKFSSFLFLLIQFESHRKKGKQKNDREKPRQ